MVKNIIFDFGNVFIEWDPRRIFRQIVADGELDSFMQSVWSEDWNDTLDRGVSLADNEKNLHAKYPQHSRYIAFFHEHWYDSLGEVNRDSVALLADLQRAGYATYGLSNWSAETFPVVRKRHPFFDMLNGIVISGEEKVGKPDPRFYQILLDRYRLDPPACAFIDDRQDNIDTAQRLGIRTVLFTTAAQVRRELSAMGVAL
ncbi:MAG: HAD family phosphatase [Prevotellaceae bacterium]|jgi:2-haloacid dehalogenase|nr:HAD family phosphatase [Prevotellaceae bacterium]